MRLYAVWGGCARVPDADVKTVDNFSQIQLSERLTYKVCNAKFCLTPTVYKMISSRISWKNAFRADLWRSSRVQYGSDTLYFKIEFRSWHPEQCHKCKTNKTKYFRLCLSDEVGTERPETDLRLTWYRSETDLCRDVSEGTSQLLQIQLILPYKISCIWGSWEVPSETSLDLWEKDEDSVL